MRRFISIFAAGLALVAGLGLAATAYAQSEEAVVSQAKGAGIVGEQADGYLGFAKAPPPDVKAAVDAVNIKRRQIYTDIAARQNATVAEVAAARGCDQLANRVSAGQAYKVGASWQVKGSGPITLPPVCG